MCHCTMCTGFITARKGSFGQGNIFIGVCQEFCSQGGCLLWGGVCSQGGCLLLGGSAPQIFFAFFCNFLLHFFSSPNTQWSMSGRYASYWNAFLFHLDLKIVVVCLNFPKIHETKKKQIRYLGPYNGVGGCSSGSPWSHL